MAKKVFISYSWGNKEHQDWVVDLGTRLMNDSVDVILDRWSLKDGHDVYSFMEEMVKSDEIFRVLIICDKNYKNKSDERVGGVGTETQIITPEIYNNQKQEKFIPIVVESDSEDKPYLPIYLSSRKYLDFSKEENFEDSYEELLRNILEAPSIPKPKLGATPPLYITESPINTSEVNSALRTLENQLTKQPEKVNTYASSFTDLFLDKLWEFQLNSDANAVSDFGNDLFNNLHSFKTLRDDFISFLIIITQPEYNVDADELISFFEKQPLYLRPKDGRHSWRSSDFDNYNIIFQELFLYTIAVCLKNKNYKLLGDLLHSKYYPKDTYGRDVESQSYVYLRQYHQNLENYISQKYNRVSGFAYYLITNIDKRVPKEYLVLSDSLCYIVWELYREGGDNYWFPDVYIYNESKKFDFLERLESKRHFEKVKDVFDVENPQELIQLVNQYADKNKNAERWTSGRTFTRIPFVHEFINADKIAINR